VAEPEVASEPEIEPAPEPVFEAPAYEAPAYEREPEPAPTPGPELEPEPVAPFERPSEPQVFEQPAPAFEAPVAPEPAAPLVTEPIAPEALPATNGQVPHDFEDDLLPPDETAPVEEAPAPAAPEAPAPAAPEAPASANGAGFRVSIRLTSGERVTVSECSDIGEAKGYAKALTKQLGTTDPDDWPFVNGRFLKPDTIVSVDVDVDEP
jgi:hypothetical protein